MLESSFYAREDNFELALRGIEEFEHIAGVSLLPSTSSLLFTALDSYYYALLDALLSSSCVSFIKSKQSGRMSMLNLYSYTKICSRRISLRRTTPQNNQTDSSGLSLSTYNLGTATGGL